MKAEEYGTDVIKPSFFPPHCPIPKFPHLQQFP